MDGVMADGLNSCSEKGEARDQGREKMSQDTSTVKSGGFKSVSNGTHQNVHMLFLEEGWLPPGHWGGRVGGESDQGLEGTVWGLCMNRKKDLLRTCNLL